jgi:hypothetical protein
MVHFGFKLLLFGTYLYNLLNIISLRFTAGFN